MRKLEQDGYGFPAAPRVLLSPESLRARPERARVRVLKKEWNRYTTLVDFKVPNKIQSQEYSRDGGKDGAVYTGSASSGRSTATGTTTVGTSRRIRSTTRTGGTPTSRFSPATPLFLPRLWRGSFRDKALAPAANHHLKIRHYIRYAYDFVFLSPDRAYLVATLPRIKSYLRDRLKLELHSQKVSIRTLASGVDFLGWVHFPHHRVLRTATKRRMLSMLRQAASPQTRASYRGMLSHGNTHRLLKLVPSD